MKTESRAPNKGGVCVLGTYTKGSWMLVGVIQRKQPALAAFCSCGIGKTRLVPGKAHYSLKAVTPP